MRDERLGRWQFLRRCRDGRGGDRSDVDIREIVRDVAPAELPPGAAAAVAAARDGPGGVAADAVDAELAVELEMRAERVADVAHARAPSSGTT